MLSLGMLASFAFWTASASAALDTGSPPPSRAATWIARASFVKCAPRRASTTAFLCLIDAHFEWPAMGPQRIEPLDYGTRPPEVRQFHQLNPASRRRSLASIDQEVHTWTRS